MPIMLLRARADAPRLTVPMPVFGPRCVCCNADARGRTKRLGVEGAGYRTLHDVAIPVCAVCDDHALLEARTAGMIASLVATGVSVAGLGITYHVTGAIVAGAAMTVAAIAWLVARVVRDRRARAQAGHHPGLQLGVAPRLSRLVTHNPALVDDLRARNPDAVFAPTRAERKRLPAARARGGHATPPAPPPPVDEAAVVRVVSLITKNTPDGLAAARAMLASGEVSAVVVEHRLAELESVLGRRDLRARLRDLRD